MTQDLTTDAGPTPVPLIERLRRATLGRFDVITVLGEGGMATVFLARDLQLDRRVAIKVMHPALMTSPVAMGRFRREARIAAALDHPHIISIFTVGEDPELAYYVMRFVEGRTLHDVIATDGAQPLKRVLAIVDATGGALNYAHRRGVIHRDVKPANIMVLDQDDWIVVTDFGIAKLDEDEGLTLSGHVVGTPNYMSPEYFNHGRISAASDQYALGIVAYELLTGVVPYGGKTVGELMRGHILDAIPSVRKLRPDLPQAVEDIISRMLAKEPAERFASVGDAVAGFHAALVHGASPEEKTEIIPATRFGVRRGATSSTSQNVVMRRRVRTVGFASAVVLIVVSVALIMQQGLTPVVPLTSGAALTDSGVVNGSPPAVPSPTPSPAGAKPGAALSTDPGQGVTRQASNVSRDTAPPANAPPASAATTGTGTVRIGSRLPLAALYVADRAPRLIGEQGIQAVEVPSGSLRLAIRLDGCTSWDTTFTVQPGSTHVIGFRAPRC